MIDFALTQEQEAFRDIAAQFASERLRPAARDADEFGTASRELVAETRALGLIDVQLPEPLGGLNARSSLTSAVVLEALANGSAGITAAALAPASLAFALADHADCQLLQQFGPVGTLAIHEATANFSPLRSRCRADSTAEGLRLTGEKRLVPIGSEANVILTLARSEDASSFDDLGLYLVPTDARGVDVRPEGDVIGLKAARFTSVVYDNVILSREARLPSGATRAVLASMRIGTAAVALGVACAAAGQANTYAQERHAFGSAIGRKQGVAFMLADMHIACESMRWLIWRAAAALDAREDWQRLSSLAANYVNRHAVKVVDDALQVFGGHGFIRDHPLELWLREARMLTLHGAITAA